MSYKCKGTNSKNKNCPIKEECYRYTRESDKDQKYYDNIPWDDNGRKCDFYLPEWVIQELNQKKDAANHHSNGKERGNTN